MKAAPSATLTPVTPKRLLASLAGLALLALIVIGLLQLGGSTPRSEPSRLTVAQMRRRLAGAPPPLAALHAQASDLLPGGLPAVRARLATLRGRPIVINKWASWCEPCREEFGVFQRVSVSEGRQVAFLGIDSGDHGQSGPLAFLRSFPLSYPSYYDPGEQAGIAVTDSTFTPVTVFYNRSGSQFIHQGPYLSVAKLEEDVRRYALDA
jgi:cytochrome c biogenesis protein CcmG, thiol:disulfide interchange protein DsbE